MEQVPPPVEKPKSKTKCPDCGAWLSFHGNKKNKVKICLACELKHRRQ